jgi:protein-S-isoprenylcysteine O-methyltransferase Ste14
MHIVKSVGVMSVAKIMGMIHGCIALIFVPFFLIIGVLGSVFGSMAGQSNNPFAGIFGVILAIFMPVIYAVFGFVAGAIGALLYNLFAKWVGGFELELQVKPANIAPYPIVPVASSGV